MGHAPGCPAFRGPNACTCGAPKTTAARCQCGVPVGVSHYCSALDHCWVGKRDTVPNPNSEHLAPNGKPIDGYPLQQE